MSLTTAAPPATITLKPSLNLAPANPHPHGTLPGTAPSLPPSSCRPAPLPCSSPHPPPHSLPVTSRRPPGTHRPTEGRRRGPGAGSRHGAERRRRRRPAGGGSAPPPPPPPPPAQGHGVPQPRRTGAAFPAPPRPGGGSPAPPPPSGRAARRTDEQTDRQADKRTDGRAAAGPSSRPYAGRGRGAILGLCAPHVPFPPVRGHFLGDMLRLRVPWAVACFVWACGVGCVDLDPLCPSWGLCRAPLGVNASPLGQGCGETWWGAAGLGAWGLSSASLVGTLPSALSLSH